MKLRGLGVAYLGALRKGIDMIDTEGLEDRLIPWKNLILTDGKIENENGDLF